MKYRLRAAIAAAALTLVPAGLFASTPGWMMTYQWDNPTSTVTGMGQSWQVTKVRHLPGTGHTFIGNPDFIPPGPCRSIAIRWNIGVFTNKPRQFFERLLQKSSQKNCNIEFNRSEIPNVDGAFDLVSVKPAK